jgi:hypothetical protein
MPAPECKIHRRQSGAWFAGQQLMDLFIQVLVEFTLKATDRIFRKIERGD